MIMASNPEPYLCGTSIVEDVHNHDDVVGLKLCYSYSECYFTVLVAHESPSDPDEDAATKVSACRLQDIIARFNEACIWTEKDNSVEDVDTRLDPVWQEVEDLVRQVAFDTIISLGDSHDRGDPKCGTSEAQNRTLTEYLFPQSFNLQLVPKNGRLTAIRRFDLPTNHRFIAEPTISPVPGLTSINSECIEVLEWCRPHVLKVKVAEKIFCCKLNNTGAQTSFLREFHTLQKINQHAQSDKIRVPKLRGLVAIEGDGVIGLLIDWIDTEYPDLMVHLRRQISVTDPVRQKWVGQIASTVEQIHSLQLTWGDAKTTNVLIDNHQDAWITDFGGGFTRGWVDQALYDTRAGDLQGIGNTFLDILGKR